MLTTRAAARQHDLGQSLVVMGVSGCGKTAVSEALAGRLGWPSRDGDAFHPPANVAKMAGGTPLTDEDRTGWLAAIGSWLADRSGPAVVSCSALKRSYRDQLRLAVARPLLFVHLSGRPELIRQRMESRPGHFMPATLLRSQLETLQPLEPDELGITVDITAAVGDIVTTCLTKLSAITTPLTQGIAS